MKENWKKNEFLKLFFSFRKSIGAREGELLRLITTV